MKALNQHPRLVSGRGEHGGREIHYFGSMHGAANATQYSLRFPLQGGDQPSRLSFDKSPDYMRSINSVRQMATLLPAAKLIVLLRDPVDRAISEFRHNCRHGRYVRAGSVVMLQDDFLSQNAASAASSLGAPSPLSRSCSLDDMNLYYFGEQSQLSPSLSPHARKEASHGYYAQQIEWILRNFPPKQVLLLFHEHMQQNLFATLTLIVSFLKITPFVSNLLGPSAARATGTEKARTRFSHPQLKSQLSELYRAHNLRLRELLLAEPQWRNLSIPSWIAI